jgi:hypothetical protein
MRTFHGAHATGIAVSSDYCVTAVMTPYTPSSSSFGPAA